mmetsp:Transcript_14159/g.30268  ORF Transcript_14159/g.30268 Transcript_14159/m.30268 type:complete len:256 (-) Transcript_14159:753-1520(-)
MAQRLLRALRDAHVMHQQHCHGRRRRCALEWLEGLEGFHPIHGARDRLDMHHAIRLAGGRHVGRHLAPLANRHHAPPVLERLGERVVGPLDDAEAVVHVVRHARLPANLRAGGLGPAAEEEGGGAVPPGGRRVPRRRVLARLLGDGVAGGGRGEVGEAGGWPRLAHAGGDGVHGHCRAHVRLPVQVDVASDDEVLLRQQLREPIADLGRLSQHIRSRHLGEGLVGHAGGVGARLGWEDQGPWRGLGRLNQLHDAR